MQERKCGRCRQPFKPSSKHKCCPKCRAAILKRPCTDCSVKLTAYGRCITCVNKSRAASGSGWITEAGYKVVSLGPDPVTGKQRRLLEHRIVMERVLGRSLLPGENVHHRNGNKSDNRPENLELWVSFQPSGQRPEDLLTWADEVIKRYRGIR